MWVSSSPARLLLRRMGMQLRSQQRTSVKRSAITALTTSASSSVIDASTRELHGAAQSSPEPVKAKKPRSNASAKAVLKPALLPDASGERVLYQYPTLVPARLIRRYKRFLADVVLVDPENEQNEVDETQAITIYCPNTGPMVGLLDEPLTRVQLSKSDDPKRKYAYTLEMVRIHNGERHVWVGVHSTSANYMVEKALLSGWFAAELGPLDSLQREVRFAKNSRVDFVLSTHDTDGDVIHQKYVEVKSVTLATRTNNGADGGNEEATHRCAVFPDKVSDRAAKHVTELMELIETRKKAIEAEKTKAFSLSGAIVFLVQRDDCASFMPSLVHDKKFATLCAQAEALGIQLVAYACSLEPQELLKKGHVRLLHALPLDEQRVKATDLLDEAGDDKVPAKPKRKSVKKK